MPFSTYAQFQTAIADQLARSDLTSQIPDFISLFEAGAAHKLKLRLQESSATLTTSSGSVALPSDYMGFRSVKWNGNPLQELEYVHPSIMTGLYPSSPSGVPQVFTIKASTLTTAPFDDTQTLAFDYFATNAAISSSLNNLFLEHPDCYWAGTLYEAYMYVKDYDQAAIWKQRLEGEWDDIRMLYFREPGNMAVRVFGQTP